MSWRGTAGGIKAASMGYDVVMAPTTYCYLDYVQASDLEKEPFSITHQWSPNKQWTENPLTLEKVYGFDPLTDIPAEAHKHILGVQCNLWTEYVAYPQHAFYMLLPRLDALIEVQWCRADQKNYEDFKARLQQLQRLYDRIGVNYCRDME
jgi:hexosaminidase